MSLNCLTCQSMPRTDSDKGFKQIYDHEKHHFSHCLGKVERRWSGNLASPPRPYEKIRTGKKATHHRIHSSGTVEFESSAPKLVRSCGMRRDWSFEDLRQCVKG
ncbi:unnamed protein product [Ilex paraguariensis]|uniref:Uncharacterized protein n=1 Tax=Ilex paraguariensis TaxID=185542 RepID=A0ABC8U102_9AQUA